MSHGLQVKSVDWAYLENKYLVLFKFEGLYYTVLETSQGYIVVRLVAAVCNNKKEIVQIYFTIPRLKDLPGAREFKHMHIAN